jgi:hypothetical protein
LPALRELTAEALRHAVPCCRGEALRDDDTLGDSMRGDSMHDDSAHDDNWRDGNGRVGS